jgi:tetratricopeptide (TPR) repeat protein
MFRLRLGLPRLRRISLIFVLLAWLMNALAQTAGPPTAVPSSTAPETSKQGSSAASSSAAEAAVIEALTTKITFENDGNFTREQTTRVQVKSDAGVKAWGLLNIPFQSSTQTVEIDYVRVKKPDGSVVITPPDNIQDLDAEITRSAPFYSDLREKHIAVKGLGKGDVLEYQVHWRTTKPLIAGQFWFEYNFHHAGAVLEERVEAKVPEGRAVKVHGPQATQSVSTGAGYRTYAWTYSQPQSAKEAAEDQKKLTESALGRQPAPDVQVSSFQNWDEVGRWYWGLQKERIEPTAAIRAKAAELTKGMADDGEKARALYNFVSTQYRYIGIAFGIGRYQPHAAEDVLTNNYGDCKDKHTLLASLLEASGVMMYPALINSSNVLEREVPSPAQFDHVIGYIPPSKGRGAIWLDTTPEITPFGFLVQRLRDKPALIMEEKSIGLEMTPADPPLTQKETFRVEGKLGEDGTLQAKIEDTSRGDGEVVLRLLFRQVPQPQWKELAQQISYGLGFAGTVSDVNASVPESTTEAFHISYSYNRKDYPDWTSNQRLTVPGLQFTMPVVRDDADYPIWLGSPTTLVSESKVELPHGYVAQAPSNVDLKYDFAEYHATYSQDHGVLFANRQLLTKMREVPIKEFDDYRNFMKSLQNDVNQYVTTTSGGGSASPKSAQSFSPQNQSPFVSIFNAIRALPDSTSQTANHLATEAAEDADKRNTASAVSSLYRAVSEDPKFTRAWAMLGILLFEQKQFDAAIDALHKAMALGQGLPAITKSLGYGLMSASKFEDSAAVWRDYIKANPQDVDGPVNLGYCLFQQKFYRESALAYEDAMKLGGNSNQLLARLGSIYLLAGEREKAASTFGKLAEVDPSGETLNDVAYQMANQDLKLPMALGYAKKAVRTAEEESQNIKLGELDSRDFKKIFKIAAYWDTLGWVDERMSNLEEAELYLRASWRLTQDGVVAGHLCHLYRREHKGALAVEMCRMAISRMSMSQQLASDQFTSEMNTAQENLKFLADGKSSAAKGADGTDLVLSEREFKIPRFMQGTESAEFFVMLASDGKSKNFKVQDVKFISGSPKMKLQGKQLTTVDFKVPAPDQTPTRFVWRGILGCYQYSGCSFALLDPSTVHSVE